MTLQTSYVGSDAACHRLSNCKEEVTFNIIVAKEVTTLVVSHLWDVA